MVPQDNDRELEEDSDLPSEAELSFYDEPSPIKKIEYTRDVLLGYQLMSFKNENAAKDWAELVENCPKINHFGLSRDSPRISRRGQLPQKPSAPTVDANVIENPNQIDRLENDNENSILRLKEGVLNKTRLLQMKLEQMKMKAAATMPE